MDGYAYHSVDVVLLQTRGAWRNVEVIIRCPEVCNVHLDI